MDCDEEDNSGVPPTLKDDESQSAVNSFILDYYKKFGKKRDLEQYFSLSTAQSDVRDPTSVFWSKLKTETESSDSGERGDKKSESSQELCRISIRFPPAQDPCTSQEEDSKTKTDSVSPPIIIEELSQDSRPNSEDEAMKSDDNNSQKSYDVLLDTSTNKPHSPSSSITSQRKLEWDSLADVGYGNESDRKTSASSLSTLERLALKQQYSNNDTQQDSNLGPPTAHSTPLDENEAKSKNKKGVGKKSTKIYKKDVDFLEVNIPHSSNINPSQSINVNLTKHISFNVEKDGKVTVDNIQKDVSVSPEKVSVEAEVPPRGRMDKEIQTSLTKAKETNALPNIPENVQTQLQSQKIPIVISLNTLRKRVRRKKLRMARRKIKSKRKSDKENIPVHERSGEQLSEAESFEYMPGHIYNQNQITANDRPSNAVDNKSSLESSGVPTTDSSKGSKHSFTKDLEKSVNFLKTALQQRADDSTLTKQLIKQVCQRLLKSKYRDDDSASDFLSGLSFSSKQLSVGERNNTTTSTSDANYSAETSKRPKKSILRTDKFNPGTIASASQSVPNLPAASNSDRVVTSNLAKHLTTSNTDSDVSSKEKSSSDNMFVKKSSEEIYEKYLQALKREEAYKRHLKDKAVFLKQKLASSDSAFKVPVRVEVKPNNRLKDLMNDLTRNNYDDGSGDASKLEGGPGANRDFDRFLSNRNQQSHSVFTLSSGNSDSHNKKSNLKKRLQCNIIDLSKPGPSKDSHYCCCPHHSGNLKVGVTDSSVQVNIKNPCSHDSCLPREITKPINITPMDGDKADKPKNSTKVISDGATGDIKYMCLCSNKIVQDVPDNFLIYKCSRLVSTGVQLDEKSPKTSSETCMCNNQTCSKRKIDNIPSTSKPPSNKSSQTDMLINMLHRKNSCRSLTHTNAQECFHKGKATPDDDNAIPLRGANTLCEATRWIQTEISINPKISDPTLSDINVVSETDCAKLVHEHCRELPNTSFTEIYSSQPEDNTGSYKSSGTLKNDNELEHKKSSGAIHNVIKENTENLEMNVERSENFTIPIQGTHMTLLVSIGSEHKADKTKHDQMKTQSIGTDKVNVVEQGTCLSEECSKGVQFDNFDNSLDHNSNSKVCEDYDEKITKIIEIPRSVCTVNTCYNVEGSIFSTYPKTSPINERKPFRRSNTDTDAVSEKSVPIEMAANMAQNKKCECNNTGNTKICPYGCPDSEGMCKGKCQDNKIDSKSKSISKQFSNESTGNDRDQQLQCSERKITTGDISKLLYKQSCGQNDKPNAQGDKCPCGCSGIKGNCKKSCKQLKLSPKEKCGKRPTDKQISTQKDALSKESDKCTCGCGGYKEYCKKSCKELKVSSKEKCGKQSVYRQISTETDDLPMEGDKCPCGCGGIKENCEISCNELKVSSKEKCGKQSVSKQISTETDDLPMEGDKCPCGCGGIKENCKLSCKELKSSSRDKCGTEPVDKESTISSQKDNSSKQSERCACGCGGVKDYCKKSCKELKISSRAQCGKQTVDKQISTVLTENDSLPKRNENGGDKHKEASVDKQMSTILTDKDISSNQNDKCPCGCGGTKDNCKQECRGLKLTTGELCGKQTIDIQKLTTSIQKDIASKQNEKCPCGCGGTKDNCKEDCTITPRSLCGKQTNKKEVGTQKNREESPKNSERHQRDEETKRILLNSESSSGNNENVKKPVKRVDGQQTDVRSSDKGHQSNSEIEVSDSVSDPILNMIQNITKKYSKKELEKSKRKKCFKEIMTVLNYLLETEDSSDPNEGIKNITESTTTADETDASIKKRSEKTTTASAKKIAEKTSQDKVKVLDKGVQPSPKKKTNPCTTESSDLPTSTDIPGTSSDSATCKVLNRIKKECERFHQKRCKIHSGKHCDPASSTSMNCDHCRRIHHCPCRSHKCKGHKKSNEKLQKSPVAYNLILETSETMFSEGTVCGDTNRPLKNIIVKIPKKKQAGGIPFNEMAAKFERNMPGTAGMDARTCRSKSLPNESEISSIEELLRNSKGATVREYLEKNRPDFVEKSSQRQSCLRYISESRANERTVKRDLLSLYVAQLPDVTELDSDDLRRLAKDLGRQMRHKPLASKFISEREMKKHSEKIYKSLPEVVQKKDEKRKENIKKTNLLMANMFKRNLQKKTLRGSVNLSNYSNVIKI